MISLCYEYLGRQAGRSAPRRHWGSRSRNGCETTRSTELLRLEMKVWKFPKLANNENCSPELPGLRRICSACGRAGLGTKARGRGSRRRPSASLRTGTPCSSERNSENAGSAGTSASSSNSSTANTQRSFVMLCWCSTMHGLPVLGQAAFLQCPLLQAKVPVAFLFLVSGSGERLGLNHRRRRQRFQHLGTGADHERRSKRNVCLRYSRLILPTKLEPAESVLFSSVRFRVWPASESRNSTWCLRASKLARRARLHLRIESSKGEVT